MTQLKLLADTMLGSLAKKLRLLGIDTAYAGDADAGKLRFLVRSQVRILLTRDINLANSLGEPAWPVRGDTLREEFLSIAGMLSAAGCQPDPFSRCLDCNGRLQDIKPAEVEGKVPPYIYQSKKSFVCCISCGKVFWEGTHRQRMEEEVQWMRGVLQGEGQLD